MSAENSPPTPSGEHVFEVTNYSLHRCLDAGLSVRSSTFNVGGYAWSISFHPSGDAQVEDSSDYVAVSLELMTKGALVEVSYDMALVDMTTGMRWFGAKSEKAELDTRCADSFCRWCLSQFKRRDELETSPYLHDDRVVIECILTVIKGSEVPEVPATAEIVVPPLFGLLKKRKNEQVSETVASGKEKPADLNGCTPRERAAILYIQSLCSSKETEGKVVFKSQRGSIAASAMRCLTLPSVIDGSDKYLESAIIDAYAVHVKAHTQGCRLLCPVWYGSMIADQDRLDCCNKPEHRSFYQNFCRTFYEYDQIFFPLLVKYGESGCHWIVAVMSTTKKEFQILDSDRNLELFEGEVEKLRNGMARMTSMARIVDPSLPNDVETWKIIEIKQLPKQTDGCSCGLYVMKYMEYWDGTKMRPNFTQGEIHIFRKKLLAELLFSDFNEVTEAKKEVGKIMKLLTGQHYTHDSKDFTLSLHWVWEIWIFKISILAVDTIVLIFVSEACDCSRMPPPSAIKLTDCVLQFKDATSN
ncbi:hypothetical protein EJB05_09023, partial [Eragrostis curvula]